jgi:ORF 12 gene product N-terminal
MVVLAGCGGSPRSSPGSGSAFPGTAAGVQARWFFQAMGRLPIPDAAMRAHFAAAFLAQNPPALINTKLAGTGQLRLVSVTPKGPDLVVFVVSVRGPQRFRIGLPVDAHGRIASIQAQELTPTASPASVLPALAPGWVAQPVTFEAGGVTIAGMWRRLWQGHVPLVQIAGLSRALHWIHGVGRLVRAEHRTAPTA